MTATEPIPFTDEHGQSCLRVPLAKAPGVFATVDRRSYDTLQAEGFTGRWLLNDNGTGKRYVRISVPVEGQSKWTLLLVARLIIGAGAGTIVRYANGNPLDLRLLNLAWRRGKSGRADNAVRLDVKRLQSMPAAQPHISDDPTRVLQAF